MKKIIYIRTEINSNEKRTPLTPNDVKILLENNFIIFVQSSNNRIFTDNEYHLVGAIITNLPWYNEIFKNAFIISLKNIDNLDKLNRHTHIYFSHTYKIQTGSIDILTKFKKSNSIIYDFEFFLDEYNKRIISFGFYAGIVGGTLGIMQFCDNLNNINYWNNFDNVLTNLKNKLFKKDITELKIALIGPNGNTGKGVINILSKLNLTFTPIYKNNSKNNLINYDIIFNCIKLCDQQFETWFDTNTKFIKKIIIVDISCDYNKPNNPIKLYNDKTTWNNPVFKYNDFVDIIAIDNLPSIIPYDSSVYFSNIFVNLLLNLNNNSWNKNLKIYKNIIFNI